MRQQPDATHERVLHGHYRSLPRTERLRILFQWQRLEDHKEAGICDTGRVLVGQDKRKYVGVWQFGDVRHDRHSVVTYAKGGLIATLLFVLSVTGCAGGGGSEGDGDGERATSTGATSAGKPTTMPEWLNQVAFCLDQLGWKVSVDIEQNGIINDTLPADQRDSFNRDNESCQDQIGRAPNDVPVTPELASEIYDHLIRMRACLAKRDFSSSEPPSRSVFVDDYMSGRAPWSPFLDVPANLSDEDWHELLRECPQEPE